MKEYNPIGCEHRLENGLSAMMFQSESTATGPETNHKVIIHVCALCGEISIGGYRYNNKTGQRHSFSETFDIHHPDAIDAIIKQANYFNEEVRWQRVPSLPASIEQEAERLYPYSENKDVYNEVGVDLQRSAHITCARQYMGEIEKLRAENEKMRGALEEIADKGLSVSDRTTWLSMQQIAKFALK